jgi:tetratricopeptide (TPR) repeat protein
MSWMCRRFARALEQSIAAGTSPTDGDHAAHCAKCARYAAEIATLDHCLRQLAAPAEPAMDRERAVWAEIDRRMHAPSSRPVARYLVPAGLCAVWAVCGWLIARPFLLKQPNPRESGIGVRSVPQSVAGYAARPDGQVVGNRQNSRLTVTPSVRSVRRETGSIERPAGRRHLRRSLVHVVTREKRARRAQVALTDRILRPSIPPSAAWAAWGAWYEQRGDYDRAAEAYRRAEVSAGEATPAVYTFEAARSAEQAGDLTTAIENYAKLLSRPTGEKPKAEKGTQIWNPFIDAV